jgi:hypothetical protein
MSITVQLPPVNGSAGPVTLGRAPVPSMPLRIPTAWLLGDLAQAGWRPSAGVDPEFLPVVQCGHCGHQATAFHSLQRDGVPMLLVACGECRLWAREV